MEVGVGSGRGHLLGDLVGDRAVAIAMDHKRGDRARHQAGEGFVVAKLFKQHASGFEFVVDRKESLAVQKTLLRRAVVLLAPGEFWVEEGVFQVKGGVAR